LIPGILGAGNTAKGDGMFTSRFLSLRMVYQSCFPVILPKMALSNSIKRQKLKFSIVFCPARILVKVDFRYAKIIRKI
jgi:hypothetical protein